MNDHIIHENNYLPFSNHLGERFIHIALESRRCVSLSEKHNKWFKNSSWSDKRRFPFVSSLDSNIGKSPSYIKLGKVR